MSDLIPESNKYQNGNGNSVNRYGLENKQFYTRPGSLNEESGGLDPRRILGIVFRYKWLIMFFLITGGVAAWFYADTVTPIYESNGTLLISTGMSTDDELSQIISQRTGMGTGSSLANELEILRSREFSRQIASKMMSEEPGDRKEFPVLWSEDEEGNFSRASEEVVTARIRRGLNSIRSDRDSDVISLSFKSHSPVEAAYITNAAMENYVESSTMQNRRAAEQTAQYLEREKEEIERNLNRSEQRLQQYMDNTGIVRVDEQASGIVNEQVQLESELQQIKLELQTIDQAISNNERQLERIKPGLADQFSEAVGPRIRNSQEELARYESERTLIISRNPGVLEREQIPPRIEYLDKQIDRLKKEIRELSNQLFTEDEEFMGMDTEDRARIVSEIQTRLIELRIQRNQNQSRKEALEGRKAEIDESFDRLPEGMMELARLQRDVRINEELFLNVSRNFADMSVLKQSQFGFGRILDTALVPGSPVSPNKKMLMLLGLMLGGVLAAGLISVKEFMDNSINSVDQLSRVPLPLLASVPVLSKVSKKKTGTFKSNGNSMPQEMIMLRDQKHFASEAIRRLKNNIVYQHGHNPPKTIAITSAEKGDGKSTIASNLGVAFAQEGFKTLLLDVDFRRPKVHTYFGLKNEPGLIDYLNGKVPFLKLFKSTDLKYLKVVSSGSETFQPETVVSNKNFNTFLEEVKEAFDVVIIDTPPFGIISDSTALLKKADTTILVTKYRKTNRGIFVKTLDELERIGASVGGVVLNGYDYRKETGGQYGSGYYEAYYQNYESYTK